GGGRPGAARSAAAGRGGRGGGQRAVDRARGARPGRGPLPPSPPSPAGLSAPRDPPSGGRASPPFFQDSVTFRCTSPLPLATNSPTSAPNVSPNSTVNSSGAIARSRPARPVSAGWIWSSDSRARATISPRRDG